MPQPEILPLNVIDVHIGISWSKIKQIVFVSVMDQAFSQRLKVIKGFYGFKMGPTISSLVLKCLLNPL